MYTRFFPTLLFVVVTILLVTLFGANPSVSYTAKADTYQHSQPEPAAISSNSTTETNDGQPETVLVTPKRQPIERNSAPYHAVPFYSQFTDITPVEWRKVGCGIASVAMLIDFYSSRAVDVDSLLQEGIESDAYLDHAGWIHSGLIDLARSFGLTGSSHSLAHLGMESAFNNLKQVVDEGPVMVSVHYTFQPTNPIPHLAVITGIKEGRVYYNDPAETRGQNSISIEQFQSAWKKRYIAIRPAI